jgi:F-type H+-transporting ATPase subunit b
MNPLVQVDPGLFLWTIFVFLALLVALTVFAWKPLLKALDARQETIRKSLDDAKAARGELERLQSESAAILRKANAEAEGIVSKSWADAEKLREEMKLKARAEADTIMKEARRQIELETGRALREIRGEVANLSVSIASKLIQRNFSKEDNDRLVQETLRQMDAN